jgi:HEAT repeat protein
MKSIGSLKSVSAGNSDTREILLNYYTARLEPGRYTLKGILEPRHSSQTFREESAPVVFEILPTPDDSLRARVANLAQNSGRNARTTAALLGFTGHPDAVAPLIDMLYSTDDGVAVGGYDALLYFRAGDVRPRLLDALRERGPRARLVHLLTVPLQASASEVNPILTTALTHTDSVVRDATIEGLRLANRPPAPDLFALLAARLSDPVATVRHRATIAVGGYQNAAALEALKGVVNDSDPTVREQAAIAVGWAAQAATPGSATRRDAIEVLRQIIQSGQDPASRQAADWLARVGG